MPKLKVTITLPYNDSSKHIADLLNSYTEILQSLEPCLEVTNNVIHEWADTKPNDYTTDETSSTSTDPETIFIEQLSNPMILKPFHKDEHSTVPREIGTILSDHSDRKRIARLYHALRSGIKDIYPGFSVKYQNIEHIRQATTMYVIYLVFINNSFDVLSKAITTFIIDPQHTTLIAENTTFSTTYNFISDMNILELLHNLESVVLDALGRMNGYFIIHTLTSEAAGWIDDPTFLHRIVMVMNSYQRRELSFMHMVYKDHENKCRNIYIKLLKEAGRYDEFIESIRASLKEIFYIS